jgi:hypothetical protein
VLRVTPVDDAPTLSTEGGVSDTPGALAGYTQVTLRARWVTLRARWVTLRARWVTLRARWVTL